MQFHGAILQIKMRSDIEFIVAIVCNGVHANPMPPGSYTQATFRSPVITSNIRRLILAEASWTVTMFESKPVIAGLATWISGL